MKDIYAKAQLLTIKEILNIDYVISPNITGTIKLTNSILLLTPATQKKLKSVLRFIEDYVVNYYILKR
jgi:hypothetical protein